MSDVEYDYPAGKNLQAQYERWQPRAKYKTHLDPTMDDVKKLAISCRRTAKVHTQLVSTVWQHEASAAHLKTATAGRVLLLSVSA